MMASKGWKVGDSIQLNNSYSLQNNNEIIKIFNSLSVLQFIDFHINFVGDSGSRTHDKISQRWNQSRYLIYTSYRCILFIKTKKKKIIASGGAGAPSVAAGTSNQSLSKGATGPGVIARPTIEDFQIPIRYQRRPIDEKEIAYINVRP